jgi:hypothetical protein
MNTQTLPYGDLRTSIDEFMTTINEHRQKLATIKLRDYICPTCETKTLTRPGIRLNLNDIFQYVCDNEITIIIHHCPKCLHISYEYVSIEISPQKINGIQIPVSVTQTYFVPMQRTDTSITSDLVSYQSMEGLSLKELNQEIYSYVIDIMFKWKTYLQQEKELELKPYSSYMEEYQNQHLPMLKCPKCQSNIVYDFSKDTAPITCCCGYMQQKITYTPNHYKLYGLKDTIDPERPVQYRWFIINHILLWSFHEKHFTGWNVMSFDEISAHMPTHQREIEDECMSNSKDTISFNIATSSIIPSEPTTTQEQHMSAPNLPMSPYGRHSVPNDTIQITMQIAQQEPADIWWDKAQIKLTTLAETFDNGIIQLTAQPIIETMLHNFRTLKASSESMPARHVTVTNSIEVSNTSSRINPYLNQYDFSLYFHGSYNSKIITITLSYHDGTITFCMAYGPPISHLQHMPSYQP